MNIHIFIIIQEWWIFIYLLLFRLSDEYSWRKVKVCIKFVFMNINEIYIGEVIKYR